MLEEREHLLTVARAVTGSEVGAERVVLETYRRWYRLDDDARARIAVPRYWLVRTASEVARTVPPGTGTRGRGQLRSPRFDRPGRVGNGDAGRQRPPVRTDAAATTVHHLVTSAFVAACAAADLPGLVDLLADDVVAVSDGGGHVRAPVRAVRGAGDVACFVSDLLGRQADLELGVAPLNGRSGVVVRRRGRVVALLTLAVADARITDLWILLDPTRLHGWSRA